MPTNPEGLREEAERMIAERLGLRYHERDDYYWHEQLCERIWPNLGIEGALWQEAVRLQMEILKVKESI